jgi:dienelactone hydrolase
MLAVFVRAEIVTKSIEYKDGDTILEGFLAYDDSKTAPAPGVLVVPEWWGLNDFIKGKAIELAREGYVAFAADLYGKGKVTTNPKQAAPWAGAIKRDRQAMRRRVTAGLDVLKQQKQVDPGKLAAIGFCLGGTGVLELARSGADIQGVVSFHGGLDSPDPSAGKNIKCAVLVLHGADDPTTPKKDIEAFEKEMKDANVDYTMVFYSQTVHAFTNPDADKVGSPAIRYNAKSARRAWQAMNDFFKEIFH